MKNFVSVPASLADQGWLPHNLCTKGALYYDCAEAQYEGCCSHNPCAAQQCSDTVQGAVTTRFYARDSVPVTKTYLLVRNVGNTSLDGGTSTTTLTSTTYVTKTLHSVCTLTTSQSLATVSALPPSSTFASAASQRSSTATYAETSNFPISLRPVSTSKSMNPPTSNTGTATQTQGTTSMTKAIVGTSSYHHTNTTSTPPGGFGAQVGRMAGITVGALAAVGAIGVLLFFCCRRRNNRLVQIGKRFARRKSSASRSIPNTPISPSHKSGFLVARSTGSVKQTDCSKDASALHTWVAKIWSRKKPDTYDQADPLEMQRQAALQRALANPTQQTSGSPEGAHLQPQNRASTRTDGSDNGFRITHEDLVREPSTSTHFSIPYHQNHHDWTPSNQKAKNVNINGKTVSWGTSNDEHTYDSYALNYTVANHSDPTHERVVETTLSVNGHAAGSPSSSILHTPDYLRGNRMKSDGRRDAAQIETSLPSPLLPLPSQRRDRQLQKEANREQGEQEEQAKKTMQARLASLGLLRRYKAYHSITEGARPGTPFAANSYNDESKSGPNSTLLPAPLRIHPPSVFNSSNNTPSFVHQDLNVEESKASAERGILSDIGLDWLTSNATPTNNKEDKTGSGTTTESDVRSPTHEAQEFARRRKSIKGTEDL